MWILYRLTIGFFLSQIISLSYLECIGEVPGQGVLIYAVFIMFQYIFSLPCLLLNLFTFRRESYWFESYRDFVLFLLFAVCVISATWFLSDASFEIFVIPLVAQFLVALGSFFINKRT